MTDCCVLLYLLFRSEELPQSPNLSPAVLTYLHVPQFFYDFFNPLQGMFIIPKGFVDYLPPPSYELHPKDALEVGTVPFGRCVAGFTRMMYFFLRKNKMKMMVSRAFVLLFPGTTELNGGS